MKEWSILNSKVPTSVDNYVKYFSGDDLEFSDLFHKKKGHTVEIAGDWAALDIDESKPALPDHEENFGDYVLSKSLNIVEPEKFKNLTWSHRREEFRLPLPLPEKVLKMIYGKDFCKKGSLMRADHFICNERLKDGSILVETRTRPLNGMLAAKFFVHMLFHVIPSPGKENESASLNLYGKLRVWNFFGSKAVETFALPFSRSLTHEWIREMKKFCQLKFGDDLNDTADKEFESTAAIAEAQKELIEAIDSSESLKQI